MKNKVNKMFTVFFEYNKPKVVQALRYHFISRKEIKILMIVVNLFALMSAALYYLKKVTPTAFILSSVLWFILMLVFWFLLPEMIYKKSRTFKDRLRISANDDTLTIENEKASKQYQWKDFSHWIESPHFFHIYINATSFFLIPKDAFEREGEKEIRNMFNAKIN